MRLVGLSLRLIMSAYCSKDRRWHRPKPADVSTRPAEKVVQVCRQIVTREIWKPVRI